MEQQLKACAVITGGSRGIGRATAEKLAANGFDIAVSARSSHELEAMQTYWAAHFPDSFLWAGQHDLAEEAGANAFAAEVLQRWAAPALLIHNVAQFAAGGIEAPAQQLMHFLSINVLAADRLTRQLLPAMQAQGSGHIVTIGSVAVFDFPAGVHNYTISKYALQGWHRCLEQQLADSNIHTTIVHPGATYTSSWEGSGVDPATLLSAHDVAEAVWQAWLLKGALREMQLRP